MSNRTPAAGKRPYGCDEAAPFRTGRAEREAGRGLVYNEGASR
jgi:hypothetical protein